MFCHSSSFKLQGNIFCRTTLYKELLRAIECLLNDGWPVEVGARLSALKPVKLDTVKGSPGRCGFATHNEQGDLVEARVAG